MFARVLLWLGTLLGLFVGLAMMANSVAGGSGISAPVRVAQGLVGAFLLWVLGRGLLRMVKGVRAG